MSLIGTLGIELHTDGGAVTGVRFDTPRPVPLDRLLAGRLPEEVPGIVGTLFPLCGLAQAACAAAALESALGTATPPDGRDARAALVAAEALREHVARIAVDWPGIAGETPDGTAFAEIQIALRSLRTALFTDDGPFVPGISARPANSDARAAVERMGEAAARLLFDDDVERWAAISTRDGMERWARAGRTAAARLLARLLGDPQPAGPEDLPEDGTPYGRYRDHPAVAALRQAHGELAARLAARLVEVAALVAALSGFAQGGAAPTTVSSTVDATEGAGHARVDVARGTLVHDVRLAGGRVAEYRIAAPTTANFSAGGAADRALLRIRGSDPGEIEWRARLTILEFDPCVAHELRIR